MDIFSRKENSTLNGARENKTNIQMYRGYFCHFLVIMARQSGSEMTVFIYILYKTGNIGAVITRL